MVLAHSNEAKIAMRYELNDEMRFEVKKKANCEARSEHQIPKNEPDLKDKESRM